MLIKESNASVNWIGIEWNCHPGTFRMLVSDDAFAFGPAPTRRHSMAKPSQKIICAQRDQSRDCWLPGGKQERVHGSMAHMMQPATNKVSRSIVDLMTRPNILFFFGGEGAAGCPRQLFHRHGLVFCEFLWDDSLFVDPVGWLSVGTCYGSG